MFRLKREHETGCIDFSTIIPTHGGEWRARTGKRVAERPHSVGREPRRRTDWIDGDAAANGGMAPIPRGKSGYADSAEGTPVGPWSTIRRRVAPSKARGRHGWWSDVRTVVNRGEDHVATRSKTSSRKSKTRIPAAARDEIGGGCAARGRTAAAIAAAGRMSTDLKREAPSRRRASAAPVPR